MIDARLGRKLGHDKGAVVLLEELVAVLFDKAVVAAEYGVLKAPCEVARVARVGIAQGRVPYGKSVVAELLGEGGHVLGAGKSEYAEAHHGRAENY